MQKLTILSVIMIFAVKTGNAIDCFQCNSSSNMECSDRLMNLNGGILEAISCDHVHNAQYCIKQTVLIFCHLTIPTDNLLNTSLIHCTSIEGFSTCTAINGRISTERYCSSLDLGSYCNYVQQPGDKLEYRTCIYTCSTDGCNGTSSIQISINYIGLGLVISKYIDF